MSRRLFQLAATLPAIALMACLASAPAALAQDGGVGAAGHAVAPWAGGASCADCSRAWRSFHRNCNALTT